MDEVQETNTDKAAQDAPEAAVQAANPAPGPTAGPFFNVIVALEKRVEELEDALHATATHLGTNHPTFKAWVDKVRARLFGAPAAKP